MKQTLSLTIHLNPRNSARLARLSRSTHVARSRLANAIIADALTSAEHTNRPFPRRRMRTRGCGDE